MEIKQVQVYKFEELKPEIQKKVLNDNFEINVDYEWYEFLFYEFKEDLLKIGVNVTTFYFDFYRERYITLGSIFIENQDLFFKSVMGIDEQILNSLSDNFEIDLSINENGNVTIQEIYKKDNPEEEISEQIKEKYEEKMTNFLQEKLKGYLKSLENEYNYLTSEEAIKDTIIANEYEFLENGDRF